MVQVDVVKEAAADLGLNVVEATVANTSEVMQATQSLVGRVDSIYIPTDNTVASSIESVVKVAEENAIPVVAGEAGMVERGALATLGIDYERLGRQTAEMALRILKGKTSGYACRIPEGHGTADQYESSRADESHHP